MTTMPLGRSHFCMTGGSCADPHARCDSFNTKIPFSIVLCGSAVDSSLGVPDRMLLSQMFVIRKGERRNPTQTIILRYRVLLTHENNSLQERAELEPSLYPLL